MQFNGYDAIVSWLTVLHIADKTSFFRQCYSLLRPGGRVFIADFFEVKTLSPTEWTVLKDEVSCGTLFNSVRAYTNALEAAGFKVKSATDVTESWRAGDNCNCGTFSRYSKRSSSFLFLCDSCTPVPQLR
jgi:cyclopropane fatty-acyl-phospholipid synthase-like methyltransferase